MESKENNNAESPKGFISAPTLDQLKPTPEEQVKLKVLWDFTNNYNPDTVVGKEICGSQYVTDQTAGYTDYVVCQHPKGHKGKHAFKKYVWTTGQQR